MRFFMQKFSGEIGIKPEVYTKPPFILLYDGQHLCTQHEILSFNGAMEVLRFVRTNCPQHYEKIAEQIRKIIHVRPEELC